MLNERKDSVITTLSEAVTTGRVSSDVTSPDVTNNSTAKALVSNPLTRLKSKLASSKSTTTESTPAAEGLAGGSSIDTVTGDPFTVTPGKLYAKFK